MGSIDSAGDKLKAQGVSSLCFALPAAIGTFDVFNGTWILFLLWINYIGWHLFPIARPMLSKPGNEIFFLPPEWRGLMHTVLLFLFTCIYLLEIMLIISVMILILAMIADVAKILPPPLSTLFNF